MLVLTAPVDPTADYVIHHLNTGGVPLARVDSADFPVQLSASATIKPGSPWAVTLGGINLDDVTAIYYRRPGRFVFSPEIHDPYLSWCEGQARYGFWGVLESLPARWVNHPRAVASAEYKPRQLAWANTCGLTIPPTLVSNNPTAVAAFAESVDGDIVTKPLYARMPRDEHGRLMGLTYVATVPPQRCRDESIRTTAHLFQQRVPSAWHIRLTVAAQHMFAIEIHQPEGAHLDWRHDRDAVSDLRPCPVPNDIRRKVTALLRHADLLYGALDFIVTPSGEWIFLELNPNGQWAWIEPTRRLITTAIVDLLTEGPSR
ncbi:MAG: hypothetical protein JO115_06595 [Pseudonocardiales bacterium]|nr:hypothetical protein [Pseudonocardiales bacterium]